MRESFPQLAAWKVKPIGDGTALEKRRGWISPCGFDPRTFRHIPLFRVIAARTAAVVRRTTVPFFDPS